MTARPDILTTDEAARYIRASKSWLDKARVSGQGPAFVKRGARVYYLRQDLDQYIDGSRQEPACPSTSGASTGASNGSDAHMRGGTASSSPEKSSRNRRARQIADELRAKSVRQGPTKSPSFHVVGASKE